MRKRWWGLLFAGVALWANNTSLFVSVSEDHASKILAHRGIHQTYAGDTVENDTCTANPIHAAEHSFIENTIPSMQAAFAMGADVVELDIHLTPDNVFAVFHDWTVDCRTDGVGQTNKIAFTDLQKLDLGYNYSVDGVTFPLRGMAVGMMPSLTQVLDQFPDQKFLVNFKSNRAQEGKAMLALLNENPKYQSQVFGVYGPSRATWIVADQFDHIRAFDKGSVKACYLRYFALGWSGYVPDVCRDALLPVPLNIAPFLWGWPHKFEQRMEGVGTSLIATGDYDGTSRTRGVDTKADLARMPDGFAGYVWTNDLPALTAQ